MPTVTTIITTAATLLLLHLLTSLISSPNYHSLFLSLSSNSSSSLHLHRLTLRPHPSSSPSDSAAADYVTNTLLSSSCNADVTSSTYDVLLSFPKHCSLSVSVGPATTVFNLTQEPIPSDPSSAFSADVIPTFLAYSPSDAASAPAVYANYARTEDFARLVQMGVKVNGTVVVARYGKIYRGDIVRNAEIAGAIAVVIYSDSKDYGDNGHLFPEGRGLPRSGVQVGSTFRGAGDPTTPGWASARDGGTCERVGVEELRREGLVPGIVALPVSARDGESILAGIGGQVADEDWQGRGEGMVYRVGPGPVVVSVEFEGEERIAGIRNVVGVIEGEEEPDRYVILGNHRDAWTFGAVDPNSGTAALLELAQRLGKLQKRGWRPRRTIILCNWDAEEYGLIGSTEWVEENREMLYSRAIAYLNVDSAVAGPGFYADATPQLDELLKEAAKQVQDPDNSSQTLYESWAGSSGSPPIGRLGGGATDFAAFIQHVGVPSVDMSFGGGYPVYHSMYDDFAWMQKFGDPMFQRHVAVASIWGLVALKLADEEFLPFDYVNYASELQRSVKLLEEDVLGTPVSFSPLYMSVEDLQKAAIKIENQKKVLETKFWSLNQKKSQIKVRELNDRLMMAERAFTDGEGLFQRPWYKHLIYGPSQNNDYGSKSFPGVDDAIQKAKNLNTSESWRFAQHEVWRAARAVRQAALVLNGQLT